MTVHDSKLCIGGPYDGKQYDHPHPTFRAPILPPMDFATVFSSDAPGDPVQITEVIYRKMFWHCGPRDDIAVWAPDTASPLEVFSRLLEAYARIHEIEDKLAKLEADVAENQQRLFHYERILAERKP